MPMKMQGINSVKWSKNIIIADADYIDHVAFDLTVNFERMLGRRIPQADLSQWIVDVALDGRLRPGDHETQVVLLHDDSRAALEHFAPSAYATELDGQAFRSDRLGEFVINCVPTGGEASRKDAVLLDLVRLLLTEERVTRLMVVPNGEDGALWQDLRAALRDVDDEQKRVTLFTMQPGRAGNYREEMLGFSIMDAMGITQAEIDGKLK